jgi:hypothetical protein
LDLTHPALHGVFNKARFATQLQLDNIAWVGRTVCVCLNRTRQVEFGGPQDADQ